MDEKYYKRFESFSISMNALAEAKTRDLSDSFVISGTGAKFCITLDLAWKTMKDIILQHYMVSGFATGSPREVLRKAFELNLISGDIWMEMLKVRNEFTHDYDGTIVEKYCKTIVETYIDVLYEFESKVQELGI